MAESLEIEVLIAEVTEAAERVARATFGPFRDEPDSPFSAAPGMTAEHTWNAIARQMPRVLAQAVSAALYRTPISVDLLRSWHEGLFSMTFPDEAGVFHEDRERGQYSAMLAPDVFRSYAGTAGRQVYRQLRDACGCFDSEAHAEEHVAEGPIRNAVAIAVRLYAAVLRIHPFLDGNGRTAYVVLQYALIRQRLPCVALDDFTEHQLALGQAIRRDSKRSEAQLVGLIVDKIREADSNF